MTFSKEQLDAVCNLISLEQLDIIDDQENEFWNDVRRNLVRLHEEDIHIAELV